MNNAILNKRGKAETAFSVATLPKDFSAHSSFSGDENPLHYNFFKCQNDMLKVLAQRMGFDLSMIVVEMQNNEALSPEERQDVSAIFNRIAKATLRKTDQMFNICQHNATINIVLPGTKAEKAEIVIEKLRTELHKQRDKMIERGKLTFAVESLHDTVNM